MGKFSFRYKITMLVYWLCDLEVRVSFYEKKNLKENINIYNFTFFYVAGDELRRVVAKYPKVTLLSNNQKIRVGVVLVCRLFIHQLKRSITKMIQVDFK